MSSECYIRVQDHSNNRGPAYGVLLVLADQAHDDGRGLCPSTDSIARLAHVGRQDVPALLEQLKRSGELTWDAQAGTYQITVEHPDDIHDQIMRLPQVITKHPRR